MFVVVTLTITSLGCWILGSGTSERRRSVSSRPTFETLQSTASYGSISTTMEGSTRMIERSKM